MKMAEDGGLLMDETKTETPEETVPEKTDPKSSIQENKVICLECSAEMRQLTVKHLSSHGLTIRDYKTQWGFPQKQSLSAICYQKRAAGPQRNGGCPRSFCGFRKRKDRKKWMRLCWMVPPIP